MKHNSNLPNPEFVSLKFAQEIFDMISEHLLTQNKKSLNRESCAYRAEDGLKCAIGFLIGDDEYHADLEGMSIGGIFMDYPDLEFTQKYKDYSALLNKLQAIHDIDGIEKWPQSLKSVAQTFNLSDLKLQILIQTIEEKRKNI